MNGFVLDCCVTMSWFFKDEASSALYSIQDRVREEGCLVPPLWHFEVGNAFIQAEKRGRITREDGVAHMELLQSLPVNTDIASQRHALNETIVLAREYSLTVYDAAYLELAVRRGVALATRDGALRAAAEKMGVPLLLERNIDLAGAAK